MAREFSDRDLDGAILDGMARALWVHAYMIWALEVEPPPDLDGRRSWDEVAPNNASTYAASMKAARELAGLLEAENQLGRWPLAKLWRKAMGEVPAGHSRKSLYPYTQGYATESTLHNFGREVAHVCMGTLDPQDLDVPFTHDLIVPHFSVELDDDGARLSWDGGWTWNGNGCNPCRHNGGAPGVLIVEDDPQIQKMYPRYVRKVLPGAVFYVVDNYLAAIGYLESHDDIVLVVSDVDIVGQRTGVDVFRWVQQNRPALVDHYIFVTGGNPHVAQIHHRFLEKPVAGLDLIKEIKAAVIEEAVAEAPATPRTRTRTSAPPATRSRATSAPPATARPATMAPAPGLDLRGFAAAVNQTASSIKSTPSPRRGELGRYGGGDKVFISAIWRVLAQDPRFRGVTLPEFKRRLVDANRERYLDLARADLVGAMDPEEVSTSEINDMGSTFHFVIDPRGFG